MCAENKCSKIVSRSATGADYIIEGNRKTWYTEDGKRYVEADGQYSGPIWYAGGGEMCPGGYKGGIGLFG